MLRLRRLCDVFKHLRSPQYQWTKESMSLLRQTPQQTSSFTHMQVTLTQLKFVQNSTPFSNALKPSVWAFSNRLPFHTRPYYYRERDECECEGYEDEEPNKSTQNIFRTLTLYVCLPVIFLGGVLLWKEGAHEERPEFIPYTYLRIRNRPFPWGDGNHSLFHNKCVNALPDGYEEDEETACHPKKT
ncbi:uncharacterized protein LOC103524337 [Diaphorina citri]|uniref:Uncharacterized protein LOC103524337 n=1 Tax=Diaphorina citri TaxID=121845 RepID=A0A1S3DTH5_DIACI|nr:uncharacterized protein LOC103524337 [Diaphorina citri]KAI5744619.1 hypothetical protein M8J76_003880 [Diaphorina citri]